jgi:NAD(P) transhydrogenase subunit alpha
VDLAVEQGGNCEVSRPGEIARTDTGVAIVGVYNLPGRVATDASNLYARNLLSFAGLLLNKEGALAPDFEDEILKAACVTRDGRVVHPNLQS